MPHREGVSTVVVVEGAHAETVEVQVVRVSSTADTCRPIVPVNPNIRKTTTRVVPITASERFSDKFIGNILDLI